MSALANAVTAVTAVKKEQPSLVQGGVSLGDWNVAERDQAILSVLPCNGSRAWAQGLAERRPFTMPDDLFSASDAVWSALRVEDWQEAFDSHPRIGEARAVAATAQSLAWSHGEQRAANLKDAARAALALGNKAYQEKFGRIFIVCATGKSAEEMLGILQSRMDNDPDTELRVAAEEQRKITQLRLRKWLGIEPGSGLGGR